MSKCCHLRAFSCALNLLNARTSRLSRSGAQKIKIEKMVKKKLKFPLKGKYLVMLAPSFVVCFPYPEIILALKKIGFDKVVELTFGAKMVNREYHSLLENSKELVISSVCPGVVETIKSSFPRYKKNIANIDSPMIATAKICKKTYPKHKIVFISPCDFKKIEAKQSKYVDFAVNYKELNEIFSEQKIDFSKFKSKETFDRFYNDYTKVYPISGGLSATVHSKKILNKKEIKVVDSVLNLKKFLKSPDKNIKFLDATFCKGSCIGGPAVFSPLNITQRKKKILEYLEKSKHENISESKKGVISKAKGISFIRR